MEEISEIASAFSLGPVLATLLELLLINYKFMYVKIRSWDLGKFQCFSLHTNK